MRACGPCQACCALFPVPALEKPAFAPCRHQCAAGCAVHDGGRPEVCRAYSCYWLDHEELADGLRPDLAGVVVTESGWVSVKRRELPLVTASLVSPGAEPPEAARALIERFRAAGLVVLVVDGPRLRIVYDRGLWAGIEPRDIEDAYRHERRKDAEELRRLGAVGPEF